jgi:phosphotransferase system  glucose/maltose/N-acetylglucosamine-specific IIC component
MSESGKEVSMSILERCGMWLFGVAGVGVMGMFSQIGIAYVFESWPLEKFNDALILFFGIPFCLFLTVFYLFVANYAVSAKE